jgi:hypothetical protein
MKLFFSLFFRSFDRHFRGGRFANQVITAALPRLSLVMHRDENPFLIVKNHQ